MVNLAGRKRAELLAKLSSIDDELGRWQAASQVREPLEKHYSQVRRLSSMLGAAIAATREKVADTDDVLVSWMELERQILRIHEIWDYFRSKLALRFVPWFRPHLVAADELAEACYAPARRRAGEKESRREPPLVFFSSVATPFAVPRGATFLPAATGVMSPELFADALQRVPFPVIGIPWYQIEHLPDALVIAHEVGHHVETDFGLTGRLEELLAASSVPGERRPAWEAWLGEVFADVWGTLGVGPGFVSALMDFVAAPGAGQLAPNDASDYPPPWLRGRLVCDVLRLTGSPSAQRLGERWRSELGDAATGPWADDAETVAGALVEATYPELGGLALRDILSFSSMDEQAAANDANRLIAGLGLQGTSPRALMAAAALAFEADARGYAARTAGVRVLDKLVEEQAKGTRASDVRAAADWEAIDAEDQQSGERLGDLLAG